MLPSLGFQEIVLLGVLALVVVGPKDLPLLLRKLGQMTAKLRAMAQEFRSGFDELARQAELDELKREVDALRRTSSLNEIARDLAQPLGTLESYTGLDQHTLAPPLPAPSVAETPPQISETPATPPAIAPPQASATKSAPEPIRAAE